MKPFPFRFLCIGLLSLPAWFAGCFTEVGNADDVKMVSGEFKIDYSPNPQPLPKTGAAVPDPDTLVISRFYLQIREAEFRSYDSVSERTVEWHLWKEDSATLAVDFSGNDTSARLPTKNVGTFHPDYLQLQCTIPGKSPLKPDTMDVNRFSDKGYIKGVLGTGKLARVFLFQLPAAGEIHLEYSQEAISRWYIGNAYHCEFVFFATKWVESAGLAGAQSARDRNGVEMAIFDTGHNAALYQTLVDRFYKSFNTTHVFAEVGG